MGEVSFPVHLSSGFWLFGYGKSFMLFREGGRGRGRGREEFIYNSFQVPWFGVQTSLTRTKGKVLLRAGFEDFIKAVQTIEEYR